MATTNLVQVVQASCEAITWYVVGRHGGAFQHQVHGVEERLCGLSKRRSGASYVGTCSVAEGNFAQQAQLCGGDLGSLESFSRSWATGFGGRCSSYESCFASALTRHSDAVRETRPMRRCYDERGQMVGVTYNVTAVPAEVVDAKTSVEESPVAVPVVVWHALHLQRTTSEHFDIDRSRTSIEVLSGTSGRAERVLRWCVSLPPACLPFTTTEGQRVRCPSITMHAAGASECPNVSILTPSTTYGRGCLLPTPRWTQ